MSTVEHIDSILEAPYGTLSKKQIEYCLNIISIKKHEVIYNTTTRLYLKMAKHALAGELWGIASICCKYVTYMINNYKVDKSMECELYLIYGYLISKTPYVQKVKIRRNKNNAIYMNKLKNDAEALKNCMLGFRMANEIKNTELIINFTVFIWNIMESWLNVSREFSYAFYFILKTFDEIITEIKYENKKWMMFIKYEYTKCLMDIKKYNYNLKKIRLKNIAKANMDIDFDINDTSIFPENSYLKNIILNVGEDVRLLFYVCIQNLLSSLPKENITKLIMTNIKEIASLAKKYDTEIYSDFLELYVKFILNNFKKPETTKHLNEIIKELNINDNEKVYISILKCFKKLPLKMEKIEKLHMKIKKYNLSFIENEEEGHTIFLDSYKWSPQNYLVDLAYLAILSKHYTKARSLLSEVKFSGYTGRTLILKEKLIELYLDLDEYLDNPTLVLLSAESIDFQLDKFKKMKELIYSYEKQEGDINYIQKVIQSMWNYMFPLLQQRLYPRIKPYIEFLHKTLERIDSPLFILRSVIGKELAKICENDLEYTRAIKYLKNAYLIVNDYNGLLKSNTYHLLNLKCSFQQKDIKVEEKLYLKIEDIQKSNNHIPDVELENILKIYLYDFTNIKRTMDVEEIITKKYNPKNYQMRYIKDFDTINRCKTTMITLLKIIDLAFQRKIYSIAFDGASIIIFNEWNENFSKIDYFKISMAHVSHIRAYIILHYWKLFKNKQLKKISSNEERLDDLIRENSRLKNENEKLNSNQRSINKKNIKNDTNVNYSKFYDYFESRKDSLPYKEKLMEDVIRAINIGLELKKEWIVNNSASIIYDFILIQSKTIINGSKDCLFMGYYEEIKILYEKLKFFKETSSLLYIYICAIYMQANIETIEFELFGEVKLTNEQRKQLENRENQPKKDLNNYFAIVKEIYNFFTTSNLNLDNYISMTISSLWIRYKLAKSDEENGMRDIGKNSLSSIDSLENIKVTSIEKYKNKIIASIDTYQKMNKSLTLSNWIESFVRIGRCAVKEKLYNHALKCFNLALKDKVPTATDSPAFKNIYDANICFYWTCIGYFELANVYQEFININYIISDIPTMNLDSISFLVECTKYLRIQSNVSNELFLEIVKRVWNISLKLIDYKETYESLEKLLYELVFLTSRITTEQKKFKENFKNPESEIVQIFSHIFSLLLELNILNNNWTSGLHIISKLNALLPINIDYNCYLEKLQFFYHTNNEMGLNALFTNKPELQLFYWTSIACMDETKKEQAEQAFNTCFNLLNNNPNKKAEYFVKYVDWMRTNDIDKEKYFEYLKKAWDLIDESISEKIKQQIDNDNVNFIYVNEEKEYSAYQIEILVRSFVLYLTIHHTLKNSINCILTIYTLLNGLISNTYKTALSLQFDYKKRKNRSNTSSRILLDNEKEVENNSNNNKKKDNKKNTKKTNKTDQKPEKLTTKDYHYLTTLPEMPKDLKDWSNEVWPEAMFSILEDSDSENIFVKKNIRSSLSLIGALCYTIEECICLLRYNYIYFFLWIIEFIINNFIEKNEKSMIECFKYTLNFHLYNKLGEKDLSSKNYYSLMKYFSVFNVNMDIFSQEKVYSIDKLDIYNEFPYNNNSIIIKIIEILLMNMYSSDLNKINGIIYQMEEKAVIKNENLMSELIYCKLVINYYLNSYISENEYIDLCKIGLNLPCDIKIKYRIAKFYFNYIKKFCSIEEFERACQFTLKLMENSKYYSTNDWYCNIIIGKIHQDIGTIMGNYVTRTDDYSRIFKLAYEYFNKGIATFDSNQLYYHKVYLIMDYIKVMYCHIFHNRIWSKNLLLICLSLIKESRIALEKFNNSLEFNEFIETDEYNHFVDSITILEIELYIIINRFKHINLYEPDDSIKHMINTYLLESYIPPNIDSTYESIKNISLKEAKNICLTLKDNIIQKNTCCKNIHTLFLYGIIQNLNPNEQTVVDLDDIIFKKTLKIGDYYNKKRKKNNSLLIKSDSSLLNQTLTNDEEKYFTDFYNNWDLSPLNEIIEKYNSKNDLDNSTVEETKNGDNDINNIENSDENNNEDSNKNENIDENDTVPPLNNFGGSKMSRKLSRLESSVNIFSTPSSSKDKKHSANDEKNKQENQLLPPQTLDDNSNYIDNDHISMIECFKNVISLGLETINYQYVQLCSEYLYKLTNDDLSLKFGYLSLFQNCVYSNIYKNLLLKTTNNPLYRYEYIRNILKEQIMNNKECFIQNNIALGWKRYVISKNYLSNFKLIPKGIDILILQHSLDKKMLYTGLINKDTQITKEGHALQYDFLEYEVNFEELQSVINDFNTIIEEYEIDCNMLDNIIKKDYNEKKEAEMSKLNQNTTDQTVNNENEKDKINESPKNRLIRNSLEKRVSTLNFRRNNTDLSNKGLEKSIETEIKENIPNNIILLFKRYINKIIEYLSPIFEHYKKMPTLDKKKKSKVNIVPEKEDKVKRSLIICCDETFLVLPLGLIFKLYSSWDIIYKEFSYNMLLQRYREQFSSEKEFPPQNQDFVEVNYLNCMINFDKDAYAKKDKSELLDLQIKNIDDLKDILINNNILNKWPGSYFTKIQNTQFEHFFSPPGFLYMSYKHLFDEIPLNKFNFNLSGINHAIFFENISISKFKTNIYKLGIKETVQTMMLLSLYGINNIYYQPYLVDLDTNMILLDNIFKCHGVPLNEVMLNLYQESKIPLTCCECFGLPTSLKIKVEKKEKEKENPKEKEKDKNKDKEKDKK